MNELNAAPGCVMVFSGIIFSMISICCLIYSVCFILKL